MGTSLILLPKIKDGKSGRDVLKLGLRTEIICISTVITHQSKRMKSKIMICAFNDPDPISNLAKNDERNSDFYFFFALGDQKYTTWPKVCGHPTIRSPIERVLMEQSIADLVAL